MPLSILTITANIGKSLQCSKVLGGTVCKLQSVNCLLDSFCWAITRCQMQFGGFVIGRINYSGHLGGLWWEEGKKGGGEERKQGGRVEGKKGGRKEGIHYFWFK